MPVFDAVISRQFAPQPPRREMTVITSLVGQHLDALDTPALLIERDVLHANVGVITSKLRKHGVG